MKRNISRISINLVEFCVSEVVDFWWRFFYFAWRKRGYGERGVMAKEGLWMVPNDANSVCSVINAESKPFDSKQLDEVTRQFR
jgi:hypothetical protein